MAGECTSAFNTHTHIEHKVILLNFLNTYIQDFFILTT